MGPIGFQEMILIALVILLLFGAKKLPELARGIGRSMGEFKKAKEDFEDELKRGEDEGREDSPVHKQSAPAPAETVAASNEDDSAAEEAEEGEQAKAKKEGAESAA